MGELAKLEPSNRGFWLGPLHIGPDGVNKVSLRASTATLSEVEITLSPDAARKFHDYTQAHVGKNLRILLDGQVMRDVRIA